jgi:FkbM family methyltransferase
MQKFQDELTLNSSEYKALCRTSKSEMNSIAFFLKYARYRYMIYRILLRMKMGKVKRDESLQRTGISTLDFLPERPYVMQCGAKAIPRRGTSDFTVLFMSLEPKVEAHLTMKQNETFVEVGANVGAYTLMVANNYIDKEVTVIAIEAHPDNFKALCRNIECNNDGLKHIVKVVNKAVSDHSGIVTMIERSTDGVRVGTSLYSLSDRFIHNGNYVKKNGRTLQLECETLDNILDGLNADVMTMDIEGTEVMALRGAPNTLKCLRKIIIEIHGNNLEAVKHLLQSNGFDIEIIAESLTYVIGSKSDQSEDHSTN